MKTKEIISIGVILASLGGAAVLGFLAFNQSGGTGSNSTEQAIVVSDSILPHGRSLDFNKIEEYNPNKKAFPFPKTTNSEISIPTSSLIKSE